jgi:hypothetical protein
MRTFILIILLLTHTSIFGQSFTVGSKKLSIHATTLTQKKTYCWVMQENDSLSLNSYYLNDLNLKAVLEKSINAELQRLGYVITKTQPQILIKYDVLKAPSRLHGVNQFNKHLLESGDSSTMVYNVEPGTLLISFINPTDGKILWQGFASGLIDSQAPIKNTALVNEAVRLVMQEYAYLVNNNSAQ